MPAPQIERLRGIKTLPQLLAYLRDELDWPIDAGGAQPLRISASRSSLKSRRNTGGVSTGHRRNRWSGGCSRMRAEPFLRMEVARTLGLGSTESSAPSLPRMQSHGRLLSREIPEALTQLLRVRRQMLKNGDPGPHFSHRGRSSADICRRFPEI